MIYNIFTSQISKTVLHMRCNIMIVVWCFVACGVLLTDDLNIY
jgi:hypothetical protein